MPPPETERPAPRPAGAAPRLQWALAGVPLVQGALFAALLPAVADGGPAALPAGLAFAAAGALALAALLWWGLGRIERAWAATAQRLQRTRDLFDLLPLGIVVYDAEDRIELFNSSFRDLYRPIADTLRPGRTFESVLRDVVGRGLVPEAVGQEEAWITERVQRHKDARWGGLREMADGRWRRIVEHRLTDGGLLSYSVDVTDLVRRERAQEAAHREAEAARALLRDAIEALPAAFELFDAEDRLILSNARLRSLYPRIAHLMDDGRRFEDVVREHRRLGGLDWIGDDFEGWLAKRLEGRRKPPAQPLLHRTADGRWMQLYESRTSSGGLVCTRADVTDWVRRGEEIERLRAALARAQGALPPGTDAAAAGPAGPAGDAGPRGLHLTADLRACGAGAPMADLDRLRALCLQAVAAAGLTAVGERFHAFPDGGGVTGVVLLAESHLALHTWPEHRAVTVDVFVCNVAADNRGRARTLLAAVEAAFDAGHVSRTALERTLAA